MCMRFNCQLTRDELSRQFRVARPSQPIVRYNIAATQNVLIIRADETGARAASYVEWGLIPNWAKDARSGERRTVAKAELMGRLPEFRQAYSRRRCLIVASGFYEWRPAAPKEEHAWHISLRSGTPMAFAGLWETWQSSEGSLVESCAIVTTAPNRTMSLVGARMPVVLSEPAFDEWLDPTNRNTRDLQNWLVPCPDPWLVVDAVSPHVKDPRNDDPKCIERITRRTRPEEETVGIPSAGSGSHILGGTVSGIYRLQSWVNAILGR